MGATAQVLRYLPEVNDPHLLVGADHFDDAGVYWLSDTTALVLTLDFFPPLVDDAYAFGQIAAANSLSDIYAMGARPLCALNILGFPDQDLPQEILGEILRGGGERVSAAGAVVAGGHSVRDAEIKYGLAVTGVVHPDEILTNADAKPGDLLVLTKPLGSGVLTSAAKAGKIAESDLAEAIDVMTDLNAGACEAMLEVGAHAVTDITGFGLVGHAHEIAEASGVSVRIDVGKVPLMQQVLRLAGDGILTRAHRSNLDHLGARFRAEPGIEEARLNILADAQTSGGLLMAVGEDDVDRMIAALKQRHTRAAAIIGQAIPRGEQSVVLRP